MFSNKRLPGLKTNQEFNKLNAEKSSNLNNKLIVNSLHSLVKNLKEKSINNSNSMCNKCNKEFDSRLALSQHMARNHESYKYKCHWNGCEFGSQLAHRLKLHLRRHQKDKPFKCTQLGCNKNFVDLKALKSHERTHKKKLNLKQVLKRTRIEKEFIIDFNDNELVNNQTISNLVQNSYDSNEPQVIKPNDNNNKGLVFGKYKKIFFELK